MSRTLLLTLAGIVALVLPVMSAESVLSRYRGVTLGTSIQEAADHLGAPMADVKLVHERPTLVQQLTWRPQRFVSGAVVEPDALSEMVLTFHLGRLARIAVTYDRERTAGMTNADLLDALSAVYGVSMLVPTPRAAADAIPESLEVIGRWDDGATHVQLWRELYPQRLRLSLTSLAADRAMQEAIADGVRLDASEAPARELARQAAGAAALRERDAKVRRDNKAAFRP